MSSAAALPGNDVQSQWSATLRQLPTIAAFESGDFDADCFDHAAHLCMAWQYLNRYALAETIDRYRSALIRVTNKLGVPEKYHETMTLFYLYEIAERMDASSRDINDAAWTAFASAHADLFSKAPLLVHRRYSPARLNAPLARRQFVLPDLAMV